MFFNAFPHVIIIIHFNPETTGSCCCPSFSSWPASISTSEQYLYTPLLTCFIYEMWKLQTWTGCGQAVQAKGACLHSISSHCVAQGRKRQERKPVNVNASRWSHQRHASKVTGCAGCTGCIRCTAQNIRAACPLLCVPLLPVSGGLFHAFPFY